MFPVPNSPFFSFSSVPTFLTRPEPPLKLGKHSLRQCHSPERPEVSAQKRPRILSSLRGSASGDKDEPWHRNDRFVRKFNPDELRAIVEPEGFVEIALDACPIHPILRPLLGLTDIVPGITHSLQLATRFLTSRHTLTFFYNLLTAQPGPLFTESQHYGVALSHLRRHKHTTAMNGLEDAEKNITIQIMVGLAPHINLQISPDPRLATRWAYTERVKLPTYIDTPAYEGIPKTWLTPAESTNPILRQVNFTGTNALVNLSSCFLRTLHPDNPLPTDAQRLRAAYLLAVTLIHELAHAVYMCRFPANLAPSFRLDEYEPFFAGQRKAELGHALETCLFGGGKILSLAQADDFSLGLAWQRWPDGEEFYVQNAKGEVEALRRIGSLAPKWETIYAVSHEWIRRQFEARFWEKLEVEGLGEGLLEVSKDLGARCRNNDFMGEGDGLQSGASSVNRGADAEGVVRPGQPFVESEEEEFSENDSDAD